MPELVPPDPTQRFSTRVEDYERWRPGYPAALIDRLERDAGMRRGCRVADLGSGTGIFSALLLERGCHVVAIEPNETMRRAAERRLGSHEGFTSFTGTAEDTGLAAGSVDAAVAAQAFHWFRLEATRREVMRILRPEGAVALVWNSRRESTSPLLRDLEALLRRFGTDYERVDHRQSAVPATLDAFFGAGHWQEAHFPNAQLLDWPGLCGRVLSASYTPPAGHPDHEPMLAALRRLFDEHEQEGRVRLDYDTEAYWGRPR